MDAERMRVQDDLRGAIDGDVFCDDVHTQLYSSDASIYELRPLGLVRPRSTADVATCVRYAAEHQLTIHPRGAGSGLAGESLGRGLVLDFSRFMRRWRYEGAETVQVQPGVVLAQLNRELAQRGRLYGPDPATRSVTTMGSVMALDASGSHWLAYGSARNTVVSLQAVTAAGEVVDLRRHRVDEPGTAGRWAAGVRGIGRRFAEHLPRLAAGARVNRSTYRLDLALAAPDGEGSGTESGSRRGATVDLARLMVGSEGTLGIITEATLRTEPMPPHRGVAMLFFARLEQAARGANVAVQHGAIACDLLDRRLLEIARETDRRYERLLARDAEAMILVELHGEDLPQLRQQLRDLIEELCDGENGAFGPCWTVKPEERDFYWRLCRRVIPRLYRLKGTTRALPFVEDMAVDPARLPEFLVTVQEVLQRHQITGTIFAHAGHGQLHLRPFLDLADEADQRRLRPLAEHLGDELLRFGGIVGGEHGVGLSRSWFLPRQLGPLWPAMVEVKRLFDPAGTLNPGKMAGTFLPDPRENLRPLVASVQLRSVQERTAEEAPHEEQAGEQPQPVLPLLQVWSEEGGIVRAVRECNGCARCRTTAPGQRMCPVFRALPAEEASPRAQANLMRGVLTGRLRLEELAGDDLRQVADLCFGCHQCRLECPASVDIPKIANESRGQHVAVNGMTLSDQLLCRLESVAMVAAKMPRLANAVLRGGFSRWFLERALGLARARQLPFFARRTFLRYAARQRLTRPVRHGDRKVVYFVDYYANWHDPDIGRALVEVLRHNGIGVYVPPRQRVSGMTRIAAGDLRGAARQARRNLRILADAVRQGYTIVTTEPTAALCLQREYPNLVDHEDARLVADNTLEACRYLWNLHRAGELKLDFESVSTRVAYHQPCHVRAIDRGQPGPQLMRLIPELTVDTIDQGCSGMAGTWGLQQKNYRNSLRIGWPLITAMRASPASQAATECSSCQQQIEHGSGRTTLHPIKLLAYAYGRLPEVGKLIQEHEEAMVEPAATAKSAAQ